MHRTAWIVALLLAAGCGDSSEECPEHPGATEGEACSTESATCGLCTDSCGFCSLLRCEAGTWVRLEAPPPPAGECTPFDCGPDLRCSIEREYCARYGSDIGGEPDGFACRALPTGCAACDCIDVGNECNELEGGGLEVVYFGG